MKIKSSLKSLKKRDLNSKMVKRRGRVYIINKKKPKFLKFLDVSGVIDILFSGLSSFVEPTFIEKISLVLL